MIYGFQSTLKTEEIGMVNGRSVHRLLEPLCYIDSSGRAITIPQGLITDFASIPRAILLVPIISMFVVGRDTNEAACLHDYLYREDAVPPVSKDEADSIFREALYSVGNIPSIAIWMIYNGVKLFGASSYHKLKVAADMFNLQVARGKK